jgi:hypothetical protein
VLDLYNNFNGNAAYGLTYESGYLGYGTGLFLIRSFSEYVTITSRQLLFNSSSFTIEVWIYPISLTTADYGLFGQCQSNSTNMCMYFLVRNSKLCCGFHNTDLLGVTTLSMNTWYHVACVYNLATLTQQVYVNGVLDASQSSAPFQGSSGNTTIGVTYVTPPGVNFFNGVMDQMQFVWTAKNSSELLNDATLVAYYSFDNGSLYDSGPNGFNGTVSGSPTSVTGAVNQALQFTAGAYFAVSYPAFYFLGITGYPFSISLWINPTNASATSTIIFVWIPGGACINFLTMTSNGSVSANLWNGAGKNALGPVLPLNSWTHIGYTYSTTNGIRLYINGTQYSTTGGFTYAPSGPFMRLALASYVGITGCWPNYWGLFTGALDEFYLYSRELTASQILALANA